MEKGFLLSGQMAKAQYAENKKKMKHPLRSAVTTTGRAHGRSQEPVACQRHARRAVRPSGHRHRQLVHPAGSGTRAPARDRTIRQAADRSARLFRRGIQHHRHRRRHRHGARRHALFAALARDHCRQRRIYGQRPQGRRTGLHLELRQDHPGHADGRHAARHPDRLRIGRARWRRGISASGRST